MSLRIEECGEIVFCNEFWDCNCETDFTHRKTKQMRCKKCDSVENECPDSRLNELVEFESHLLTRSELAFARAYLEARAKKALDK